MGKEIYLNNERKCYFCGRTDEIEKEMRRAFKEFTDIDESIVVKEFRLREYKVQLNSFINHFDKSELSDLDCLYGNYIIVFACPICLAGLRKVSSLLGKTI